LDTWHWYRRFGWIDTRAMPVRRPFQDPALDWLRAHPGVRDVFGGYWDVYRLSFLTGGEGPGMPYPGLPEPVPGMVGGAGEGPTPHPYGPEVPRGDVLSGRRAA